MKGTHRVIIQTKRLRYDFELKRNITIIRGDSATGKTTLIDMIQEYVKSKDFSKEIQATDNYYVIVSREGLPTLPYSVDEIYGIRTSGKYGTLKQYYHEFYRIYGENTLTKTIKPETVIIEDSNSGYQFFDSVCSDYDLKCISAGGKSNVFHHLNF